MRAVARLATHAFGGVVAVAGFGIFFGDLFFWHSASAVVHIYSLLSLASWTVGGILLMIDKWSLYVGYAAAVHLLVTVIAVLANQTYSVFALLLAGTDIALILIARNQYQQSVARKQA